MSTIETRPLRADAERNRQRILAAATTLFAERGIDVSMEEIAGAAGVGVGTLYRRFADREALIDALFEEKIAAIVLLVREALAIEDPWDSFEHFFRAMADKQAHDQGLRQTILSTGRGRERVAHARDQIRPLAAQVVSRAQTAGVLRSDLEPFDISMLQTAIGHVADASRSVAPEYHQRIVTIALDGLRARRDATTPMSSKGLTPGQFQDALAGRRC